MTARARMPYFPFFPADFLASGKVSLMDPCEVGAHILLLCQAWLSEPPASVPDDDRILARWARMSDEQWGAAKVRVLSAWELRDGRWFQPRMASEWARAVDAKSAQIEGGRKGGLKSAQGRLKPTSSQPSRVPQAFSESESESKQQPKPVVVASAPPGPTEDRLDELTAIRNALVGVGFNAQRAIRLSGTPGLTIRTVEWVIAKAASEGIVDQRAYIAAGIRDGWTPDAPAPAKPAEYKPPRMGAWK